MQKTVQITAKDGGVFDAFAVYPQTDVQAPAIIVIQEIFGVNQNVKSICENLAQAGYLAIAPDLFWRQEKGVVLDDLQENDMKKAFALFGGFDVALGIADLKSTLETVRNDPQCNGRVGTMGYCLGGKLAYLMATQSDADCNVSYYGVGIQDLLAEAGAIQNPLLMHIAEKDKFVPLEAQKKILDVLNDHEYVDLFVYPDVEHAFARINGQHYDKEAAHQANHRTAAFLASCLTG